MNWVKLRKVTAARANCAGKHGRLIEALDGWLKVFWGTHITFERQFDRISTPNDSGPAPAAGEIALLLQQFMQDAIDDRIAVAPTYVTGLSAAIRALKEAPYDVMEGALEEHVLLALHFDVDLTAAGRVFVQMDRGTDGRWIADVPDLPGVTQHGATRAEAQAKCQALVHRLIAHSFELLAGPEPERGAARESELEKKS